MSYSASSPALLHDRLDHLHLSKLKKRKILELSKIQSLKCESCELEKHVHSSFSKRTGIRCNSIFSIIHSDI